MGFFKKKQRATKDTSQTIKIKGISKTLIFTGENGMHARPAGRLAKIAKSYPDTTMHIHANGKSAKLTSLPSILSLNISPQTEIVVNADGKNKERAFDEIIAYIENELNHEKSAVSEETENDTIYDALDLEPDSKIIEGIKASPGMVVGKVFKWEQDNEFDIIEKSADIHYEKNILKQSVETAIKQLQTLKNEMLEQKMEKESEIIDSHIIILEDEIIFDEIDKDIVAGRTAAYALNTVFNAQVVLLEQLDDPVLRARSYDMNDIKNRLLRILSNKNETQSLPTDTPFILVSKELTPTQTASLHKHPVLGICTVLGGETSHMAILARALGLPALVGLGDTLMDLDDEQTIIIDAQAGRIITNPSDALTQKATLANESFKKHQDKEEAEALSDAITEDGIKIEVLCNIANSKDVQAVIEKGGEGIGLFRTEFLFEESVERPSIDSQYQELLSVVQSLKDKPVIIRTMDIGGDKPVAWMDMPKEDNPFLGIRGIRLLFDNEDVFRDQLSSIYMVALWQEEQNIPVTCRIMFPMISKLSEFLKAKKIALSVQKSLKAPSVPLGVMIETPSLALTAKYVAEEADFFSIGTNDLTQYTLAMDRMHPSLSKRADSLHPSILQLIFLTIEAGGANTHVGVCGNMAADPVMLTVLIAIGIRDVSVSAANVPAVKYLIRRLNTKNLDELKEKVLHSGNGTDVRNYCEEFFKKNLVHKLK